MANKEVTFYTHPSTYINPYNAPVSPHYNRVAGLRIDNETLWAKLRVLPSENSYSKTNTEAQTFELPASLVNAVANYFQDFHVNPVPLYTLSGPFSEYATQSNCHRFGASVWADNPHSFLEASSVVSAVIGEEQRLDPVAAMPLPVGQLAVIGTIDPSDNMRGFNAAYPHHTMVSLGSSRYIQISALAGNLGISQSLETTLALYQERQHPSVEIYHSQNISPPDPDPEFVDNFRRTIG